MNGENRPTKASKLLRDFLTGAPDSARLRERLAELLSVNVMTVRRWEWGARVPVDRLKVALQLEIGIRPGDWYVPADEERRQAS